MLCLDEITPEERELIIQLRERVRNELPAPELSKSEEDQDLFLVRWIRARDNNLDKATAMLRNSLNWRKVHNADKVLETERHPFYAMNYKYSFPGLDKFGRPAILPMNEWDARKIGTDPELLKEYDVFCTRFFEEMMDNIQKAHVNRGNGHPPITQIFIISDVKNYPYGQLLNFSAVKKLLQGAVRMNTVHITYHNHTDHH
ncbi:unnamed protein product [Orchesella dallaii]|uniref:CRAL/TRIO N-terminal domain-containing protein n=1 Tax=Orchesella dallaii TaxID=48710 RepID=A0ABP1RFI0_9HEXA